MSKLSATFITRFLFAVYAVVVVWVLLFKFGVQFSYMEDRHVNFVPFREVTSQHERLDVPQVVLNVLIFLPLGVYVGVLCRSWAWGRKFLVFFVASLLIEALQYLLRVGAFDVTDIINNTAGGVLGLLTYQLTDKLSGHPARSQHFINIVATVGTGVMLVLLFLLKTNQLGIRYQ